MFPLLKVRKQTKFFYAISQVSGYLEKGVGTGLGTKGAGLLSSQVW